MLRVPKRGWIPPSLKGSPKSSPSRRAVPPSPSGPAAYERWSKRMLVILTPHFVEPDIGVHNKVGVAAPLLCPWLLRS